MSLLFNILSRFVVTFQSSSDSMAAVTVHSDFGVQEEELCDYFHLFPFYLPCSNGVRCNNLSFLIFSFKPALSLSPFTFIKRLFSSSSLPAIRVVLSAYLRLLFLPAILLIVLGLHNGEGNGTPLQYCCLENPMDGGAWWAAVHGVAKSQT